MSLSNSTFSEIICDNDSASETEIEDYSDSDTDIDDDFSSTSSGVWSDGHFQPKEWNFSANAGINSEIHLDSAIPLDYFEHICDSNFVEHLVSQTNLYHFQQNCNEYSHSAPWQDTEISEMYVFLAVVMLMGIVHKPNIKDYWSSNPLLETPMIPKLFTRDRFLSLLRFLHFSDNTVNDGSRLRKIQPIIEMFKNKFASTLVPFQNLCIDESLVLYKGRLGFKQYIPSKRNRFGVKIFMLCDCETKFVLDFIIYTGSETNIPSCPDIGVSGAIVTYE